MDGAAGCVGNGGAGGSAVDGMAEGWATKEEGAALDDAMANRGVSHQ